MKTASGFLLYFGLTWLFACRTETPLTPEENLDSLQCDQAWWQFRLAKDRVLTLRYGKEEQLVMEKDTLKLAIIDILDECSEESARLILGCKSATKLSLRLNNRGCGRTF